MHIVLVYYNVVRISEGFAMHTSYTYILISITYISKIYIYV